MPPPPPPAASSHIPALHASARPTSNGQRNALHLLSSAQRLVAVFFFLLARGLVGSSGDTSSMPYEEDRGRTSRPLSLMPSSFKPTVGQKQQRLDWMIAAVDACCEQPVTERAAHGSQAARAHPRPKYLCGAA
ncbi:hypothetical protein SEVIR_5G154700v4 [Setaria viridis]|uniref:Uncharacterized protein n=1 Tax=Setaria viridis TaxID=4556 RepID=A0A4U6UHR2_SETVI|nr:hypothetical protein SEVIR_5G154700v2 [Setaria viridis]